MKLDQTPIIGGGHRQRAVFRTEVREEAANYNIFNAASWLLKSKAVSRIHRNAMLKGHEWLVKPQARKAA